MNAQEERRSRSRPETLRLRAIRPELTVSNLRASLSWYCDVVGFTLADTRERGGHIVGVSLVAGSERLVLIQDDGIHGERVGTLDCHLYLETAQDIDHLAAGVRARGGVLESGPMELPWGARGFSLVDPDGFKVTIASQG